MWFWTLLNMGGCCCSSRKAHLQGTPVYYCCPSASEEQGTFPCNHSAPGIPNRLLVRLNLDTSSPDTFRPPPAPIPFSVLFGRPQSPLGTLRRQVADCNATEQLPESKLNLEDEKKVNGFGTSASQGMSNKSDRKKTLADILFAPPTKSLAESMKSDEQDELTSQEEDSCPICFEVYDAENPKMVSNCEHEFHLSCILEWMERSDSCLVCGKWCSNLLNEPQGLSTSQTNNQIRFNGVALSLFILVRSSSVRLRARLQNSS